MYPLIEPDTLGVGAMSKKPAIGFQHLCSNPRPVISLNIDVASLTQLVSPALAMQEHQATHH